MDSQDAKTQLVLLLLSMYSPDELNRFVFSEPRRKDMARDLPINRGTPTDFAWSVVGLYQSFGMIDGAFWDRLRQDRRWRTSEIDAVAATWAASLHADRPAEA